MRRRIVLTAIAMCALGVAVLFVPMALAVRDQSTRQDVLELQRLATVATLQVPADLSSLDDATGGTWGPEEDGGEHSYAVYDPTGRRIAGRGPMTADPVVASALAGTIAAGTVGSESVAAVALGAGDQVTGAVRVAEPRQESATRIRTSILQMTALAVAAIAIAALIGWLLFLRLLRPVDRLRSAAGQLGDGDFSVEVPRTGMPELDQVGQALAATAQRIGGLVRRERAFSADASHQLRTPLAAARVVLETELLSPRDDPSLAIREALGVLDRLEATVTGLLRLSREDQVDRARVEISGALDAAAGRWAAAYQQRARELRVAHPAPGHPHTSAAALSHILDVLLDNALRHGLGAVTLAAEPAVGGVAITVTDGGTITESGHDIFQRRHPKATGTGIGLALARSLAEAEGARLSLRRSSPTTFELVIPDSPFAS